MLAMYHEILLVWSRKMGIFLKSHFRKTVSRADFSSVRGMAFDLLRI
jgi:hypothetical protein